nr:DUF397 domain-containing protein [Streptomyces phyllanthi]
MHHHMHHPTHRCTHHCTSDSVRNGMPARDLGSQGWSKPWSDDAGGACVEAKKLADGRVAIRQSTDPDGPALVFTPHEMTSFLTGVKAGDADFLL